MSGPWSKAAHYLLDEPANYLLKKAKAQDYTAAPHDIAVGASHWPDLLDSPLNALRRVSPRVSATISDNPIQNTISDWRAQLFPTPGSVFGDLPKQAEMRETPEEQWVQQLTELANPIWMARPRHVAQLVGGANRMVAGMRRAATPTLINSEVATTPGTTANAGRLQQLFHTRGTGEPVPSDAYIDQAREVGDKLHAMAVRESGGPLAEMPVRYGQGSWVGDAGPEFNRLYQQEAQLKPGDLVAKPELMRYLNQTGRNLDQQVLAAVRPVPVPLKTGANVIEMHPHAGMEDELTRVLGSKLPWDAPVVQTPRGTSLVYGLGDNGAALPLSAVEQRLKDSGVDLGDLIAKPHSYAYAGARDRAAAFPLEPKSILGTQAPSAGLRAMKEWADSFGEARARIAAQRAAQRVQGYTPPSADLSDYVLAEP